MKNQNIAFRLRKQELDHVSTEQERIRILEELVILNPKDPRDLAFRTQFKKELALLKKKKGGKKKGGTPFTNPYEVIKHNRQVVLVGETNSGKSTLLNVLTGAEAKVSETPFTTYRPESGIFVYRDVPFQIVEVPPIYVEDNDKTKRMFIRNADAICIAAKDEGELKSTISHLEDYLIIASKEFTNPRTHKYRSKGEIIEKPSFVAAWKVFKSDDYSVVDIDSLDQIGSEIYRLLNVMRVYCFKDGSIEGNPVVFPVGQGATVRDFAEKLGFSRPKGARIFGSSNAYDGQSVSLDFKLDDGEKVNLKLT